ncbi:ASCH domain-containing protein [Lactococcus nasutitermitis]|uniref:ASCH domain-containing protein n=1 Tax=Lactococcus nasutitermitis TaxID=1652957 RepID=A0ABV9JCQ1_9LACT|nr:ASCH domain-containing protein [Lactococcus nasutitermitis]
MNEKELKFIEKAGFLAEDFRGSWAFGDSKGMADELAELVLAGKKTATASAVAGYEEDEEFPAADGKLDLLLDGDENPVAILRNIKVERVIFSEVSKEQAFKEGEGDRTLAYWRRVHKEFWRAFDLFSPDMEVLTEEFEVVYKEK